MGQSFPIRGLGRYGVLTDPDPYDLPTEAFSFGSNFRVRNGRLTRGPVFRTAHLLGSVSPRFIAANNPTSGLDQVYLGYLSGHVYSYANGVETDYSPNTGCVTNVNVTAGGTSYTTAPTVAFSGGGGSGAAGFAVLISGTVGYVVMTSPGTGYTSAPTVGFSGGGGSGAAATAEYIPAWSSSNAEAPWTKCHLANLFYTNRPDRVPWVFTPSTTVFQPLMNWDSTWRAQILRSYSGCLVAFNITKGAVNYPTMVKTSDFPLSGSVPASWNESIETLATTENILAEMEGPIVDAQTLRNLMVIYGNNECWLMQFDGSQEVFSYTPLFYNRGIINTNCVVEVQGKHYVFGTDDIWVHDGVSQDSICFGRVREFIFGAINQSMNYRCFVDHDAQRKEIGFNFVSGDAHVYFLNAPDGCNRRAVYNYSTDTWAFDDLPLVYYGDRANLNTVQTYASTSLTYNTTGGTYLDQDDSFKRNLVFVGDSNSGYSLSASLYAFDWFGPGSTVAFAVDVNASAAPWYMEKDGIDLDQVGADLKGYKIVQSIVPQGRFGSGEPATTPMQFSFGAADYFNATPTFSAYQLFDGATAYKLDFGQAGRYLSMRLLYPDFNYASLSGFDLDLDVLGER